MAIRKRKRGKNSLSLFLPDRRPDYLTIQFDKSGTNGVVEVNLHNFDVFCGFGITESFPAGPAVSIGFGWILARPIEDITRGQWVSKYFLDGNSLNAGGSWYLGYSVTDVLLDDRKEHVQANEISISTDIGLDAGGTSSVQIRSFADALRLYLGTVENFDNPRQILEVILTLLKRNIKNNIKKDILDYDRWEKWRFPKRAK